MPRLPRDHYRVFRAATTYAFVDVAEFRKHLEGVRRSADSGMRRRGRELRFCAAADFRKIIAGAPSLLQVNKERGVPQGCPISDVLSNIYMFKFDKSIAEFARQSDGLYRRYADDILVVVPEAPHMEKHVRTLVDNTIKVECGGLTIQDEKTSIHRFRYKDDRLVCELIGGAKGKNGFEYLGFRFDGQHVFIRDSSLSNHYRKMTYAVRGAVKRYIEKNGCVSGDGDAGTFPKEYLYQRFGKVADWRKKASDYHAWTFYSYAVRAHEIMAPVGSRIEKQLARQRKNYERRLEYELCRAMGRVNE